jgi:hypothetical protein
MRYGGSRLRAPMPEGGLLGPTADLVDHRVGQPDGVLGRKVAKYVLNHAFQPTS